MFVGHRKQELWHGFSTDFHRMPRKQSQTYAHQSENTFISTP
jgi:hypothetical protein